MTEHSTVNEAKTAEAKRGAPAKVREANGDAASQSKRDPSKRPPYAYYLAFLAILCVSVVFVVVWVIPTPEVFNQSSQVIAVLTATYGVIGTLVGVYFGIKSTGDARDTVERVQQTQLNNLRQTSLGPNGSGLPSTQWGHGAAKGRESQLDA